MAGRPFTKTHSGRISAAKKGRRLTAEHRRAISAGARFQKREGLVLKATGPRGEVRVYYTAAAAARDLRCSR